MQFEAWTDHPVGMTDQHQGQTIRRTMYGQQVDAVQKHVDQSGEPPLDRHPPSNQVSH